MKGSRIWAKVSPPDTLARSVLQRLQELEEEKCVEQRKVGSLTVAWRLIEDL